MNAVTSWAFAFALTQLLEIPVYRLGGWRIGTAFGASAITHPILTLAIDFELIDATRMTALVAAEVVVALVEGVWLRMRERQPLPFAWSFAANGFSFCAGLALFGPP